LVCSAWQYFAAAQLFALDWYVSLYSCQIFRKSSALLEEQSKKTTSPSRAPILHRYALRIRPRKRSSLNELKRAYLLELIHQARKRSNMNVSTVALCLDHFATDAKKKPGIFFSGVAAGHWSLPSHRDAGQAIAGCCHAALGSMLAAPYRPAHLKPVHGSRFSRLYSVFHWPQISAKGRSLLT